MDSTNFDFFAYLKNAMNTESIKAFIDYARKNVSVVEFLQNAMKNKDVRELLRNDMANNKISNKDVIELMQNDTIDKDVKELLLKAIEISGVREFLLYALINPTIPIFNALLQFESDYRTHSSKLFLSHELYDTEPEKQHSAEWWNRFRNEPWIPRALKPYGISSKDVDTVLTNL